VVDRNNYHLFTPLLYQVASSLLNPSDIAQPVRKIFRGKTNVHVRLAEVTGVDSRSKLVRTSTGEEIAYDSLVVAAGSTTNFFGLKSAEQTALGLKDLPEAMELRNHILRRLETAALETDEGKQRELLTVVIVGGGPTGVEYAGALSELMRLVVPKEYPELARRQVRILLVEAMDGVLPSFPTKLGRAARHELERRGVEVRTGAKVEDVQESLVLLSNGERVNATTLVWAAGVKPAELASTLEASRSRTGRIEVDEFLRIKGMESVFAIGDIASVVQDGKEVPMLSAPAMQEARVVAHNVLATWRAAPLRPFRYSDRGSMATIGRNAAVAQLRWLHLDLKGFLGWITWLVVHLYYLIGFRNRIAVLLGWAWNYLRLDRPVRIIARAKS
jgi:NADH dehydrogenase